MAWTDSEDRREATDADQRPGARADARDRRSISECAQCPIGWFQRESDKDHCDRPRNGTIAAGAGAVAVEIADGWHAVNCTADGICTGNEVEGSGPISERDSDGCNDGKESGNSVNFLKD